jgi:DNA-binding NarL/FixJ family response regulator
MNKISVYIADNQALTRIGIIQVLNNYLNQNIETKEFATRETLIGQIKNDKPQILIIDYDLFDFNDISEMQLICKLSPETGVLIITDNQSAEDISKLVGLGFSNYVLKTCTEQELIEGFNATLNNRKYFSSEVLDIIIGQRSKPKSMQEPGKLTASETEIVKMISQGLTTKEIASQRNLSFHTVITHRKNIFRKLGINSTSELMMYAMRNGLIDNLEYYI